MTDDTKLKEIGDGLFGLRDGLDRRLRQLRDIQRALDATECGLEGLQDSGGACGAAILRLLLRYLQEWERDMLRHARQIDRLEAAVGEAVGELGQKK